jgi:hypothetical protein
MGEGAACRACHAATVDSIGGAKILTARLRGDGDESAEAAVAPIAADDAIPLFHWAGVEPAVEPTLSAAPPPRRRWPFRSA